MSHNRVITCLGWAFPLFALSISPSARSQTTVKAAVTDPDSQQFCISRLVGSGRGVAPATDCLEAFGIAKLSPSSQRAWIDNLVRRSDAWDRTCLQHFAEWANQAGYAPPSQGSEDNDRFLSAKEECRSAFVATVFNAGGARSTPKEWIDKILKLNAISQANNGSKTSAGSQASSGPAPAATVALISAPPLDRYYPKSSRQAREQGRAVASCLIGRDGRAHSCTIVQSSGSPALDEATLRVVTDMEFRVSGGASEAGIRTNVPVRWSL